MISTKGIPGSTEVMKPEQANQGYRWPKLLTSQVPILVVYFALAFYRSGHQSLWGDEIRSIEVSAPTGSLFTGDILFRGQGPLYFVLLHLWAKLAHSEAFLRALSALLGGIAVSLAYVIGGRLCDQRVARIGAFLFATSPFLIWYSQEVRYVTLVITTALVAMFAFTVVLSAKRLGRWLCYCGSLIAAIAASPLNLFLPVTQSLYLLWFPSHRPIVRKWMICQLLVFALFAWWANRGHVQQLGGYWQRLWVQITTSNEKLSSMDPEERLSSGSSREFTVMALPYTFFAFSTGFSLGPSLQELHVSRSSATIWRHAFTLSVASLLFGSLWLVGFAALWRQPDTGRFLDLWLAIPIVGVFGISALIPAMAYNVRYVAMALPAYCFILAAGIARFRRPTVQIALMAAVLLVNGLSLANYYYNPRYSREDARNAAQYLEAAAHPQDIILVVGSTGALEYYYRGRVPMVSWDSETLENSAASVDRMQELGHNHGQVWVVAIRPWEADPKAAVKAALDARYHLVEHKQFPGVDIYSYQLH
jgi:mannosyltransferase